MNIIIQDKMHYKYYKNIKWSSGLAWVIRTLTRA